MQQQALMEAAEVAEVAEVAAEEAEEVAEVAQVAELPEVAQEVLKFLGTSHQRQCATGRSSLRWQWYAGLESMWLLWSQSSHLLDSCNRRGARLDMCRDLHHKRE